MNLFGGKAAGRASAGRRVSFLISPSWGARTLHWSLPIWGARVCVVGVVILMLSLALGVGHYGMMLADAREAEALREENATLRTHYHKLATLEAELANLSEELAQLRWIAGLDVYSDLEDYETGDSIRDDDPN